MEIQYIVIHPLNWTCSRAGQPGIMCFHGDLLWLKDCQLCCATLSSLLATFWLLIRYMFRPLSVVDCFAVSMQPLLCQGQSSGLWLVVQQRDGWQITKTNPLVPAKHKSFFVKCVWLDKMTKSKKRKQCPHHFRIEPWLWNTVQTSWNTKWTCTLCCFLTHWHFLCRLQAIRIQRSAEGPEWTIVDRGRWKFRSCRPTAINTQLNMSAVWKINASTLLSNSCI